MDMKMFIRIFFSIIASGIFTIILANNALSQFENNRGQAFAWKNMEDREFKGSKRNFGRPSPRVIGAFVPRKANITDMESRGFIETGLQAVYPTNANCLKIDSPFAVNTRHDGSERNHRFYEGLHGGADISAKGGTPLLAMADGTVVRKHEGQNIGGISIWVRHTPDDTGLNVFIYSEYKHLEKMPDIEINQKVKMGEVVGRVGNTGTTDGRAYGMEGHYHLHWTTFYSQEPGFRNRRMLIPIDGQWMDPLALFLKSSLNSQEIVELSDEEKKVKISYMTKNGEIFPPNSKIIWPIACKKSN